MIRSNMKNHLKTVSVLFVAGLLSSCSSSSSTEDYGSSSRMATGGQATLSSDVYADERSLMVAERAYKQHSDDPEAAAEYARALRKAGRLNRAAIILSPFVNDAAIQSADVKSEYASLQAASGQYRLAETYAKEALALDDESGQAAHILGVSLDAQGLHKDAEPAFRMALANWEGDPTPVMNNLALNLAAQGKLDEAISILHEAKSLSPGRVEIERNLRIVTALQGPVMLEPSAPRPSAKPVTEEKMSAMDVEKVESESIEPASGSMEMEATDDPKEIVTYRHRND